ncbi:MAG: cobalamin transport operon protein [Halobacteriales archaeon]
MQRWKQYAGLLTLLAVGFAGGLWGFRSTGGALPWGKRSATALQRGLQEGGGTLVDLGRGVVIAGPIRQGGMVLEYGALVVLMTAAGISLYVYADRASDRDGRDRATRQP